MTPTADHYLTERVMTASPAELTAMLFDAAVGAVKVAIRLQDSGDAMAARPKLQKASDIVLELRTTLNADAGDLAVNLNALYTWCWQLLLQASTRGDTDKAREALDVLEPLQQAWRQSCLSRAA